jgi:hypothetical protein
MSKTLRALVAAATGVALAGAIATAPASAAEPAPDAPVIVDGVQRGPAQLQKLRGTKLFVVDAKAGQPLIAFTDRSEFKAYVHKHLGMTLGKSPRAIKKGATAKASWAGDYATFYTDYNGYGPNFNVNSGYGANDLSFVGCFLWFCSNYNDNISSVYTHGVPAVLYTETNYRGGTYVVGANQHANIPWWFNDVASSAYVYWS